ncbi:MAG: hypothetical protein NTZ97_03010 [Candidatus Moranbacteria bacterium]|nr:hypothetical protein [Candidatus Moranbacteria bacterium]
MPLSVQSEQTNELPPPMDISPAAQPAQPEQQAVVPPPAVQAPQAQPLQPQMQNQPAPVQPMQSIQQPAPANLPEQTQQKIMPVVMGRMAFVDGELQRLIPGENGAKGEWVPVEKDTPFGIYNAVASNTEIKAEAIFPSNIVLRIGGIVELQMLKLDAELMETDLSSGIVRFYNNGNSSIKCATAVGYVQSEPGSGAVFDVIFDKSKNVAEVIAVKGTVSFYNSAGRQDVIAGSNSLVVNDKVVTAGTGKTGANWEAWNIQRDNLWDTQMAQGKESEKYLPESIRNEAYSLKDGKWGSVMYEGQPRAFWRPNVPVGWKPYETGHWVEYEDDQVWVPNESFGYVTHHYGNWVNVDGVWFWAPPVEHYVVGSPYLPIYDTWYPGRVAWGYEGDYVGWLPLAYNEPYYSPYWDNYYGYYGHHGYYPYPGWYGGYGYGYADVSFHDYHYYGGGYGTFVHHGDLYHSYGGYHNARIANYDGFKNVRSGRMDGSRFGGDRFRSSNRIANSRPNKSFNDRAMANRNRGGNFQKSGGPFNRGNERIGGPGRNKPFDRGQGKLGGGQNRPGNDRPLFNKGQGAGKERIKSPGQGQNRPGSQMNRDKQRQPQRQQRMEQRQQKQQKQPQRQQRMEQRQQKQQKQPQRQQRMEQRQQKQQRPERQQKMERRQQQPRQQKVQRQQPQKQQRQPKQSNKSGGGGGKKWKK